MDKVWLVDHEWPSDDEPTVMPCVFKTKELALKACEVYAETFVREGHTFTPRQVDFVT